MSFLRRHPDLVACVLLLVATVVYATNFVDFNVPPFEDAAMLMRYADHLAHGYGIVWNIGEHPVDGATDFLFMVASAGLIKIGAPVGRSVRAIGFASHLLTVLLVYWTNRRIWKVNILFSFISGIYLAVGTGLSYVAAFFGTPFFALLAVLTWTLGLLLIQNQNPPFWLSLAFALSGLITGLIRPEGAILAGLMMVSVIVTKGWHASLKTSLVFVAVFLLLGGAYFFWRWNYFGYPLPNPFYKKSGGILHWDSFWESLANLIRFGGPFTLAFLFGFRSSKAARHSLAFVIPLVGFAALFVLISNETNFGGRFQYALLPIMLISWHPLVGGLGGEIGLSWIVPASIRERGALILAGLVVALAIVYYSWSQNCTLTIAQQTCGIAYEADGRYDVAKALSSDQDKGYVVATSEAGLLPFYSNWTAVDAWGLNDEWIAHHGEVTEEYLDQYKPQLIVFHAYFSPLVPPRLNERNLSQDWFRMTITLKDYAEKRGYILAAAFGDSPYEAHYYYVRADFPDSAKIVREISGAKYYWFASGKRAINYAEIQP